MSDDVSARVRAAAAYVSLLHAVDESEEFFAAAESDDEFIPVAARPLSELEVQSLWETGALGSEGSTVAHGKVRILDFGVWNRGPGPDFRDAVLEINGRRITGDVEIDPCAQDWEAHGHGANPLYNRVVLHVVLAPPPSGWFTRDSLHREVPILHLPLPQVRAALGMSAADRRPASVTMCAATLEGMNDAQVRSLLHAAAAHRMDCKRRRFRRRALAFGEKQAWYEAWAETLGYSANQAAMLTLARRAPLRALRSSHAEAILLGTAGVLTPMLPDVASAEAREYHRALWDEWWRLEDRFALAPERAIRWTYGGIRPLNHPHRRIAALAASTREWDSIAPLLNVEHAPRLVKALTSISHPFWSKHCTLASAELKRKVALIGHERVTDFLTNHVYVQDDSPGAWSAYLNLRSAQKSATAQRAALRIFGSRRAESLAPMLRYCFAQQGLLQVYADFCSLNSCGECLLPEQLLRWKASWPDHGSVC